jgi:hypothetical protein
MTGLEFLVWCGVLFLLIVVPALVVSFCRNYGHCEEGLEGGYLRGTACFISFAFLTYIAIVILWWDNDEHISHLLAYPIAISMVIPAHVLLVLLFAKLISTFFPAEEHATICLTHYLLLFIVATFLWLDLYKGLDSKLLTLIGGETFQEAKETVRSQMPTTHEGPSSESEVGTFYVTNNCEHPITLLLRYKTLAGRWRTTGTWEIEKNQAYYLEDTEGRRLQTDYAYWFYYAETSHGADLTWSGAHNYDYQGTTFPMIKMEDREGDINWSLSCDSTVKKPKLKPSTKSTAPKESTSPRPKAPENKCIIKPVMSDKEIAICREVG